MTPSPSRRSPAPEYARATIKRPYPGVPLPDHYSPYAYSHAPHQRPQFPQSGPHPPTYNPSSHNSYYRPLHGEDPYYYPHHAYARTLHKAGYRPPHPPMPHPPAPPAPPRPQRLRDVHPNLGRGSPRSPTAPTVNYYRAQAEYDTQHVPPRPHLPLDRARSSQSHEEDASLRQSRSERKRRSRSESTGSRCGSDVPENTPSPVDPECVQRWGDQYSHARSNYSSTGSGSYREDERAENSSEYDVIDPALMDPSQSRYSPSSHGYDGPESTIDDVSLDGNGAGDVDTEPEDEEIDVLNSQKRPNAEYYPSPHHKAQFAALAKKRVVGQQLQIGLNSLVDGELGERPAYPIPTIIKCAILGSPHRQLTLSELYTAMEERFPYYRTSDKKSWRNSVRHNLSLNNQFDKKPRPMTEPGKGHYWVVNTEIPQGNKRERKRNKKLGKRALASLAAQEGRLARDQMAKQSAEVNSNTNTDTNDANKDGANKNGDKEAPNDSQLTGVPSVFPSRGHVIVTLPANAGSYAAVTGAVPVPEINRRLYRPWQGDTSSSSSIGNDSIQVVPSISASSVSASSVSAPQQEADVVQKTIPPGESEQTLDNQSTSEPPPSGDSSPRPTVLAKNQLSRGATQGSGSGEKSSCGVQRSSKSRDSRLFNPLAVGPSPSTPRRSAFETLAAQIEREGIGASGSGGPGSRIRRQLDRSRRRAIDDDDDSDSESDPSGDEEYLPNRIRGR